MLIPIAEYENGKFFVEEVRLGNIKYYYFIAENGTRSTKYKSLQSAQLDIKHIYGHLPGFRLLEPSE